MALNSDIPSWVLVRFRDVRYIEEPRWRITEKSVAMNNNRVAWVTQDNTIDIHTFTTNQLTEISNLYSYAVGPTKIVLNNNWLAYHALGTNNSADRFGTYVYSYNLNTSTPTKLSNEIACMDT